MTPTSVPLLLLDMLASPGITAPTRLQGMTAEDWQALQHVARQHRLGPMLHYRFLVSQQRSLLPAAVRDDWERQYRKSATRSLVIQHALVTVQARLLDAGIRSAALKGAWLAWQMYDEPALRPMRDIDLLVADDQVEQAYAVLIAAGAGPAPKSNISVGEARASHKHMPPLVFGHPRVCFEIHWRLSLPAPDEDPQAQIAQTTALLARSVDVIVGKEKVTCLDPTDTLLHLIAHAVYDHRLDNGPTILSDLAAILTKADIDWPRFWEMLDSQGRRPGAELLFALVAEYHHIQPERLGNAASCKPPAELIEAAKALMIKDLDQRTEVYFDAEMVAAGNLFGKARMIGRRAFPPRHIVAHYSGRSTESSWLWLWYPVRLADYAWRYLRKRSNSGRQLDVSREHVLHAWLAKGPRPSE